MTTKLPDVYFGRLDIASLNRVRAEIREKNKTEKDIRCATVISDSMPVKPSFVTQCLQKAVAELLLTWP